MASSQDSKHFDKLYFNFTSLLPLLRIPKIIHLPNLHALRPQDIIRRDNMEEEIRQRELLQILLASQLPHAGSGPDLDDLVLFAVGGVRLHGIQDLEGLGDAGLQLREGGFGVGEGDGGVVA